MISVVCAGLAVEEIAGLCGGAGLVQHKCSTTYVCNIHTLATDHAVHVCKSTSVGRRCGRQTPVHPTPELACSVAVT